MNEALITKDCVGCGFCCTKTLCDVARRVYSTSATPCPALIWTGKRHVCKLMTLPGSLGASYRQELYAGEGCCCGLNSWRREPLVDRTLPVSQKTSFENPVPEALQIFISVMAREFISSDKLSFILYGFKSELLKRGRSEDEVNVIITRCVELFKGQRTSFMQQFLG